MTCRPVRLDNGTTAIVCGSKPPMKRCRCGASSTLMCDWKLGEGKTCDKPICRGCAAEVAQDKHLCGEHQVAYRSWREVRGGKERGNG